MKKILLISVALMVGAATTCYSIPVRDYNTSIDENGPIAIDAITSQSFTLNENAPVSLAGVSSESQFETTVAYNTYARWAPQWFNRPDWGSLYYDLFSYFTYNPKNSPGGVPSTVPEPGTILLLGSGLIGLAYISRKRMNS